MATSGSTNFSDTRSSLITDAYIRIGAVDPSESAVEAEQYAYGSRVLNRMMKGWQSLGYNLWRDEELTFPLVAGQQSYTMGGTTPDVATRPFRIVGARYRDAQSKDLPMMEISRSDYFDLPVKSTSGTPTTFYYNPGRDQGEFYVWPVPDANSANTIQLTYQRTFEDFDQNNDEPDVPQEWYEAIVYNLAARLAPAVFPTVPAIAADVRAEAAYALETALSGDRETASLILKRRWD